MPCATPTRRTSCACASSSRASARSRTWTTAARCTSSRKIRDTACRDSFFKVQQTMTAVKDSAAGASAPGASVDTSLSTTGPQAALAGADVLAGGPHLTLNTKPLFKLMVEKKASDLFFTCNAPIKIKIEGQILPVNKQVLTPETVKQTA